MIKALRFDLSPSFSLDNKLYLKNIVGRSRGILDVLRGKLFFPLLGFSGCGIFCLQPKIGKVILWKNVHYVKRSFWVDLTWIKSRQNLKKAVQKIFSELFRWKSKRPVNLLQSLVFIGVCCHICTLPFFFHCAKIFNVNLKIQKWKGFGHIWTIPF